ncbi:MAG: molybdate ABC transporter permease subunit [Defluviitaleaceae bacterium]|nr:molybdate ABC transporter permease subunit [Defluviitaleaceae bacterium]
MDFRPFVISIQVAVTATVFTFFLGLFAANFVYKMKRGKGIIDTLFTLPMILPPTVAGFFLLTTFGRQGFVGSFLESVFDIRIVFTPTGAVIASIFVAFPLMYRTARGAFEQIDQNVIYAAQTLGFSRHKIFWTLKVPMAKSGILAGAVLAFARALGEFGATMMLAGNIPGRTQTMAIAVFSAVNTGNIQLAYTWVAILTAMSFAMIMLMNFWASPRHRRRKNVPKN